MSEACPLVPRCLWLTLGVRASVESQSPAHQPLSSQRRGVYRSLPRSTPAVPGGSLSVFTAVYLSPAQPSPGQRTSPSVSAWSGIRWTRQSLSPGPSPSAQSPSLLVNSHSGTPVTSFCSQLLQRTEICLRKTNAVILNKSGHQLIHSFEWKNICLSYFCLLKAELSVL